MHAGCGVKSACVFDEEDRWIDNESSQLDVKFYGGLTEVEFVGESHPFRWKMRNGWGARVYSEFENALVN